MKKNIFSLVVVSCLFISGISARDYQLQTDNDEISGTLKTLTKDKMLKLTGNFGTYKVQTEEFETSGTNVGWFGLFGDVSSNSSTTRRKQVVNPFVEASKRYMAVIVKIKNNSCETILLPKGEYIDGLENYFVEKEELEEPYKKFISSDEGAKVVSYVIGGGLGVMFALGAGAKVLGARDVPILTLPLFAAGSALAFFVGFKFNDDIAQKTKKMREVLDYTKVNGKLRKKSSSYHKIPAGGTFLDLFLVDLKEEGSGRNVFKKVPPVLCYKTRN